MRTFIPALIALSLFTAACNNDAESSEETATKTELAGEWLGQIRVTDEQIDEMHASYPEGDREALERSMRLSQESMVYALKLNEDDTFSLGIVGTELGTMNGSWLESEDGSKITITFSADTQANQSMPPVQLNVSQDNQSITMSDMLGMNSSIKFTRPGVVEIVKPSFEDPFEYATSGSEEDYVGSWTMSFENLDSMWDSMRGTMSEENVQTQIAELKKDTSTLIFSDDMTYEMTDTNGVQKGSWELGEEGSIIILTSEQVGAIKVSMALSSDKKAIVMHDLTGSGAPVLSFIKNN